MCVWVFRIGTLPDLVSVWVFRIRHHSDTEDKALLRYLKGPVLNSALLPLRYLLIRSSSCVQMCRCCASVLTSLICLHTCDIYSFGKKGRLSATREKACTGLFIESGVEFPLEPEFEISDRKAGMRWHWKMNIILNQTRSKERGVQTETAEFKNRKNRRRKKLEKEIVEGRRGVRGQERGEQCHMHKRGMNMTNN